MKDFRYIYDSVEKLNLTPDQKQLLLMRFTIMMDKIKRKLGIYAAWHTCTKTCLIVGNILVPSVLSVEAFLFDIENVRQIIFWFVWILSIVIALILISSFVTFCNTQKKYNLYNQFNAKIRRELWAYLTLSGRYMIRDHHLRLLGRKSLSSSNNDSAGEDEGEYLFDLEANNKEEEDEEEDEEEEAKEEDGGDDNGFHSPEDLFEEVAFFNVDEVPEIMNRGHMLHYHSFLNRLETLYRFLTNSNIDIEVEDMSNLELNNPSAIRGVRRPNNLPPL